MRITTFTEPIWPCIKQATDHFVAKRKEPCAGLIKSGFNFFIVLGSACYLEGVLESLLRALLMCRRDDINRPDIRELDSRRAIYHYYNRIEGDLSRRLGRGVGAAAYDEMFELLCGHRLSGMEGVAPIWEGVTVLFNFRNVLGHGREVLARHFEGGSVEGGFKEEFSGSYRVVENYLLKKKLLDRRFTEAHSEYVFLSDLIADHFWDLAKALPANVTSSLPENDKNACLKWLDRIVKAGEAAAL